MKNPIVFIEIPSVDFMRTVKFYETVFGTKLNVCDECESEKMAFFSDFTDKPNVSISWSPNFHPSKDGTLIHFLTDNIEKTLARVNANGGTILRTKTKIEAEGMGFFAIFADSEGNSIGLYSEN